MLIAAPVIVVKMHRDEAILQEFKALQDIDTDLLGSIVSAIRS